MAQLKQYDLQGQEIGNIEVKDELLDVTINQQLIKDYLVAILANRRQWSAKTKGRSEINHSNAKPRPQKGSGRARQGTIKASQYRGGAAVFGPRPKFDQHVKVNRKQKQAAIRFLIAEKIKQNAVHILDLGEVERPATKQAALFLKKLSLANKKVAFVGDCSDVGIKNFYLSVRNIPKTQFSLIANMNGYDMINAQEMVVLTPAVERFIALLERKDESKKSL